METILILFLFLSSACFPPPGVLSQHTMLAQHMTHQTRNRSRPLPSEIENNSIGLDEIIETPKISLYQTKTDSNREVYYGTRFFPLNHQASCVFSRLDLFYYRISQASLHLPSNACQIISYCFRISIFRKYFLCPALYQNPVTSFSVSLSRVFSCQGDLP